MKNNSNAINKDLDIAHLRTVLNDYLENEKPIYTEPKGASQTEKLKLQPKETFKCLCVPEDKIKSQLPMEYFMSDREHLVRVTKDDRVVWVKPTSRGKNGRPKFMLRGFKNGISTYTLYHIVWAEKINVFGLAKELMEQNLENAFGQIAYEPHEGMTAQELIGGLQGSHIYRYNPNKPDRAEEIQILPRGLHDLLGHPVQPDEPVKKHRAYEQKLRKQVDAVAPGEIVAQFRPIDKNGKILSQQGYYQVLKTDGNNIIVIFDTDIEYLDAYYTLLMPEIQKKAERIGKNTYTSFAFWAEDDLVNVIIMRF